MWSRLTAALYGAVAFAAPALAQTPGGGDLPRAERGIAWLWIVAAVLVVAALLSLFFGGRARRGEPPPARRP
jgi:bacteriorhodopsin